MPKTPTLICSGLLAVLAAGLLLPVDTLLAQMPEGYVANRNLGDTGPANPPAPTPEERQAAGPINATLAAEAIEQITVPDGFEATVYSTPPVYNSPTAIAVTADGTVFVAGDGNGAQSYFPNMGHIVRLRDTDGDGRADETTQFVPDIDVPRGLLWYDDHLIVMAPPNISAFYDHDGDGVADEQRILIRGVGRLLAEARVDHGQNNLEAGMDGWIYLALGDQGIHDATGSDGRRLQHHGGGVMRFRPDGSQMEMWATGTRNIYGVAVGPVLDSFARDNTNDGGGWNVRFHHFSGMTEHGYPSLFINFPGEFIEPLADFGGGSGIGAVWIDEPGIPEHWNNAPFTADYGRTGLYHHHLLPHGATYALPAGPDGTPDIAGAGNEPFITVQNPVDADIDARSNIYLATWRGGGFSWGATSRERGMVYRIAPRNFTPAPVPNYDTLDAAGLMTDLQGPSYRRRIEAQRAILRRNLGASLAPQLVAAARDEARTIEQRAAAIYTLHLALGAESFETLTQLVSDPSVAAVALRALGDDTSQASGPGFPRAVVEGALSSSDPVVRKEALIALARADAVESATAIAEHMDDADPVVAHTAMQALRRLSAVDAALAVLDSPTSSEARRRGALQVLQSMHDLDVVSALSNRLARATDATRRLELVGALSRLANREAPWNGTWWATRPSTTGPYYEAEEWEGTPAVTAALNAAVSDAAAGEIAAMGREIQRNGASAGAAVARFLTFADTEPSLIPQITAYFADAQTIPPDAIPVLRRVMTADDTDATVRLQALRALVRTDDAESWAAVPSALESLAGAGGGRGRGGFGGRGGAAPVADPAAALTPVQTALVTAMDAGVVDQLRAVTDARAAVVEASLASPPDAAAVAMRVESLAAAERTLAAARRDYFDRIQDSVARLSAPQIEALAAQQAVATPPAGGGRGFGGGGRGGRGGAGGGPAADARAAVLSSPRLDDHYGVFVEQAERVDGDTSTAADGVLLSLAARPIGSPEPRQAAETSLTQGWTEPRRKIQIISAAVDTGDTSRALQIADATDDSDFAVAQTAENALGTLGIDVDELRAEAAAPRLGTMTTEAVMNGLSSARGSVARGQRLVSELGCTACHTVSADEPPKGPFLGGVAGIMTREQIAQAILDPNATISQGFATYQIDLQDGTSVVGFIVQEAASAITVRNIAGQESTIPTSRITGRTQLSMSLMPPGLTAGITLNDFASLLDYLQSLSQ